MSCRPILAAVLLLLGVPAVGGSQTDGVISVKPARSADTTNLRLRFMPNGDFNASAVSVLMLLSYAYDLPVNPSPRLLGLPLWRESYDVEAKAPTIALPRELSATEKRRRVREMVRRVLADRFKLVMNVEQKTMPAYALRLASEGSRLQKSTIAETDCAFDYVFDMSSLNSCHHFVVGRGHPLNARAINMDDLALYIENWADMPVVNRTALEGLFVAQIEGWKPLRLPPPPPGNPTAGTFDDLPSIFTVLRKLGLELEKQEARVPVYTIEHIERPQVD